MEEVIHGLFFLIQISPHLQRKRRTAQFHGYLCKRGRSLIIRDKPFIEFIYIYIKRETINDELKKYCVD